MNRPTFIHSGGDVIWTGDCRTPLTEADRDYLRRVYRDECLAALAAGDEPAFEAAKTLLAELILAEGEQLAWKRCASAPRHNPIADMLGNSSNKAA